MITIAAVHAGNFADRGEEYVAKLFAGVRRHLSLPWRGVCFTDGAVTLPEGIEAKPIPDGIPASWWCKLAMFRPGAFEPGERVLYFDLDTVITDSLDDIASYAGPFAICRDAYFPDHYQSCVMGWEAGVLDAVWTRWDEAGRPMTDRRGDQGWIEDNAPDADPWQDLFPGQLGSFKARVRYGNTPDLRVCFFHGRPRPHELNNPQAFNDIVRRHWILGDADGLLRNAG